MQSASPTPADLPDRSDLERRIEDFRWRAAWVGAWALAVRWLAFALLGWGLAVLVLRAGLGMRGGWWLLGLVMVPALAGAALVRSWRRRPDREQVRALFDRHHRRGGLWMLAGEELDGLEPWTDAGAGADPAAVAVGSLTATRAPDPQVRWRATHDGGRLAAAVAFLAAAVLLPSPELAGGDRPLALDHRVETLEEQVEALAEEELIDQETRQALESTLERVVEDSSAEEPARTWEALDHLSQSLERRAEEGVEEALAEGQQLAAMDRVAERLAEDDAALDESLRRGALSELETMVAEAAARDGLLGDRLARELAALAEGLGQGEAFDRLRSALGDGLGELGDSLENLRQAGLIDLERLQQAERILARRDDSELIGFLMTQGKKQSAQLCDGPGVGDGRGEIRRGPGHAPLDLDNDSDPEGVELQPLVLPPDAVAALEQSRLLGVSVSAPSGRSEGPGEGGALDGATAGRGGAHTRVILPQHRKAVERFFDRGVADGGTEDRDTEDRGNQDRGNQDRGTEDRGNQDRNATRSGEAERQPDEGDEG